MYTHSFNQIYKAVCALILFYKSQLLRNLAHAQEPHYRSNGQPWMDVETFTCLCINTFAHTRTHQVRNVMSGREIRSALIVSNQHGSPAAPVITSTQYAWLWLFKVPITLIQHIFCVCKQSSLGLIIIITFQRDMVSYSACIETGKRYHSHIIQN